MTHTAPTTVFVVCLLIVCSPNLAGAAERKAVQHTSTMPARTMAAETINLPPIPHEAMRLQGRLYPMLRPSVGAWVGEEAKKLAAGTMNVESLHPAAQSRFKTTGQSDTGSIEAMAFLVLMQATNDMDEDLKNILAESKRLLEGKRKISDLLANVQKDIARSGGRKSDDRCTPPTCGAYARELTAASSELSQLYPNRRMRFQEPKTVNDLKPLQDALKNGLGGMNEMSEMTSLRLQMMMDRRSKFISTLSNIMKKISTTQDTIVQNLK